MAAARAVVVMAAVAMAVVVMAAVARALVVMAVVAMAVVVMAAVARAGVVMAVVALAVVVMAREQPLRALVTAARPHTPESACIVRSLQRDALEFRRCSQLSAMLAGPQRAC